MGVPYVRTDGPYIIITVTPVVHKHIKYNNITYFYYYIWRERALIYVYMYKRKKSVLLLIIFDPHGMTVQIDWCLRIPAARYLSCVMCSGIVLEVYVWLLDNDIFVLIRYGCNNGGRGSIDDV